MPQRPPKQWFNRCVRRVSKDRPEVDDPNALCGWLWYHGMKRVTKKAILEAEKKYKADPDYLKVRDKLIHKPQIVDYFDVEAKSGLIRVLIREKDSFPEFALYMPKDFTFASLEDAGLREEESGKWVLRTDKFNIFVYEV